MKRVFVALIFASTFGLAACDVNEGPVEEAGEAVDNAMTDAGNQIEDTCENVKEEMGTEDQDC